MKNTLGSAVTLTIFGESHGEEIGAVLDGLAPGIRVDEGEIAARLAQRRPSGAISTARSEPDPFRIVSGVLGGYTTGTPIAILIPNTQVRSGDYQALSGKARPGHADYAAEQKYHGYQDERGGGHFSGRVTAALVAAGAICRAALREKGVELGSHILSLGGKWDRPFSTDEKALLGELRALDRMDFAVLDEQAGEAMKEAILTAKAEGDSVGGRLESAVCGLAAGLGEPWFDSVESMLSHALFSIGGVKGVAFGDGFDLCDMRGSEANDPFRYTEQGRVVTDTNRNGGINGGITNGMPLRFVTAVKPTPTLLRPQQTVDFRRGVNITLTAAGRHDPAIVHRVRSVVDALTALVLCDLLTVRYGSDYLTHS